MTLSATQLRSRWFTGAALLLLTLLELGGIRSLPDVLTGMHPPSKVDQFYRYVAEQLAEPRLCEKIPWSVMVPGGWDYAASYERSECYETIAGNTRDAALCWKVKRLGRISILRHQTSVWSCLARARHHDLSGIGISPEDLVRFFARIGYSPEVVQAEGITPPLIDAKDLYTSLTDRYGTEVGKTRAGGSRTVLIRGLIDQKALLARIEDLIGGVGAQPNRRAFEVEDRAYLIDLAALITKDSRWCQRIPADFELASEPSSFRNWCLYKLAHETRGFGICEQITIADGSDPRVSLRANCIRDVVSTVPSMTHYGPEVPPDNNRTRGLLALLKFPIPRFEDLPLEQIYQADDLFLRELSAGKDAQHLNARQRFVARVNQLDANN